MYQRILIATDGSSLSRKALKCGIELASSLDAELFIVHVVPYYPHTYFEGAVVMSPEDIGRVEKEWMGEAQKGVNAARDEAHKQQVKANALTVKSDLIAQSLINAAKKHRCDLIVMASHGRKGIKRLLLGSETMDVLTHSHTPVLVLR
jgi:nucleotide-binding universal stress UspA family protein